MRAAHDAHAGSGNETSDSSLVYGGWGLRQHWDACVRHLARHQELAPVLKEVPELIASE